MDDKQPPPCPTCGGCGQISFFKGESRFLLSEEECPACYGLGYLLEEEGKDKTQASNGRQQ